MLTNAFDCINAPEYKGAIFKKSSDFRSIGGEFGIVKMAASLGMKRF
jgi:hypothetical protein